MAQNMDEPEPFLSRWSRLKREAREEPPSPEETAEDAPLAEVPAEEEAATVPESEPFDPASLPPVESLGADSDYTPFLRAEVPQELRLMALRKAWVSDPVISNFRGFAEYDWDFNAPGYGRLLPTDRILDMVENIVRDEPAPTRPPAEEEAAPAVASAEAADDATADCHSRDDENPEHPDERPPAAGSAPTQG